MRQHLFYRDRIKLRVTLDLATNQLIGSKEGFFCTSVIIAFYTLHITSKKI